jgi:ABC-type sugar transport system permease subunit
MKKIATVLNGMSENPKNINPKRNKQQGLSSARRKSIIFYTVLVIPPLIQFFIYYIIINANSVFLAFKDYNSFGDSYSWVGFANFATFFKDFFNGNGVLPDALKNSLACYGLNLLMIPLTLFFPFYIYKKMPFADFFKIVLFLPSVISGMILGLLYQTFMDEVIPHLWQTWFEVNVSPLMADTNTRFMTAWAYGAFMGFGSEMILYTGAMARIPPELVEYGELEGITPIGEFFKITLPMIYPTVTTYFVLGMFGIFTSQMNLFTFFGTGSSVRTLGYHQYSLTVDSSNAKIYYPYISAMGLVFSVISTPLVLFVRRLINKFDPEAEY